MKQGVSPAPRPMAVAAAFAAIYIIWGSTYLAIRYGLETLPPFLMAGTRFLIAGGVMYAWVRLRGTGRPQRFHWRSAAVIGGLLLLGGNGGVTWAEQTVPSGVTALLITTVPLWMVLLNWLQPGGVRPGAVEAVGVLLGFSGVVVLMGFNDLAAGSAVDRVGAAVLVFASLSWALGSIYSRHAKLPEHPLLATAMEMLTGGALLTIVGLLTGEGSRVAFETVSLRSLLSLAYLVVFGSLVGFTSYVWLLRVTTPARVSTYAFVNPVVAVFLGAWLAGEPLTPRTLIAALVIVTAVVLITLRRTRPARDEAARPGQTDECITDQAAVPRGVVFPTDGSSAPSGELFALGEIQAEQARADRPYHEFLRADSMSVGLYTLPAGGVDRQQPHTEDEVYYVVAGRARFRLGAAEHLVKTGSILYVPAGVEHRFTCIREPLTLLVVFSPAESWGAECDEKLVTTSCT